MKKAEKEKIYREGLSLMDYPIDVDMDGDSESNGSIEHIVAHEGKYYFVQVSWNGSEISRVSEINEDEVLKEGGNVADAIKLHKNKN